MVSIKLTKLRHVQYFPQIRVPFIFLGPKCVTYNENLSRQKFDRSPRSTFMVLAVTYNFNEKYRKFTSSNWDSSMKNILLLKTKIILKIYFQQLPSIVLSTLWTFVFLGNGRWDQRCPFFKNPIFQKYGRSAQIRDRVPKETVSLL